MCVGTVGFTHTSNNMHHHLPLTSPITSMQINNDMPATYTVPADGIGPHTHEISFVMADFATLRSGAFITKTTDVDATGHQHTYRIQCSG